MSILTYKQFIYKYLLYSKMIILSAPCLNNLIAMVIGIICSQSVVLCKIFQELKGNKYFIHVKEGFTFLYKILTAYNFDVTILAYRRFKSIDLFKFIDEELKWK